MASNSKTYVIEIISAPTKITKHKLKRPNYLEWSQKIRTYLRSIEKDDHLTEDPPTDNIRQAWLRDDAHLFLQITNSIDSNVVGQLIIVNQ